MPRTSLAPSILLFFWHIWYLDYTPDDAYITFRYAENWVQGRGIVFNPGEYVEGYTNFLWLCGSALAARFGWSPVVVAKIIGALSGVIGLCLTSELASLVGRATRWPALAALVLAAHGSYAVWCVSALETGFFTMMIALAFYLALGPRQRDLSASLILGVIGLIRPDGLYFVVACVAIRWALDRRFPAHLLVLATPMLVVHEGWRWLYYGSLVPNTFSVRLGHGMSHVSVIGQGLEYLGRFVFRYETFALLFLGVGMIQRALSRQAQGLAVACLGWMLYIVLVGGDRNCYFRFFVPLTPLLCALASASLEHMTARKRRAGLVLASLLGLWVAQLLALSFVGAERSDPRTGLVVERALMENRVALGRWMRDNLPPHTVVATVAAGAIPYYSRLATVDVLGVTDRHIASRDLRGLHPTAHDKTDVEYVFRRHPSAFADAGTWAALGIAFGENWAPVRVPNVEGIQLMIDHRRIPRSG